MEIDVGTSGPNTGPTLEAIAEKIRIHENEWGGNCGPVCEAILAAELVNPALSPRIVNGLWIGEIEPGTMYDGQAHVPHAWIEVDDITSDHKLIIDPTRHIFEGFEPNQFVWCGPNDDSYRSVHDDLAVVLDKFDELNCALHDLRKLAGLAEFPDNPLEIMNGITDKVGRVARLVKHNHRNDPKPDWQDTMADELAGVFNYILMAAGCHELDLMGGFERELKHALEDHAPCYN
jgi:hypothetical protein